VKNTHKDESEHISDGTGINADQDSPSLPEYELAQARIKELESQNASLRNKLWRIQYKDTILTGVILSSVGAVCLLFSYIQNILILTFIGLGLILWGVLIIYMSPLRHVRAELLNSVSSTMHKSIDNLITYLGYDGQVIFFHPKGLAGQAQGYVFIPHMTTKIDGKSNPTSDVLNLLPYNNESSIPQIYLNAKGMFLAAPSQGIVDLVEKELGLNLATVDLAQLQRLLPKLMIEDLKIVDDMSIEEGIEGDIVMKAVGGPCVDVCQFVGRETHLGAHLGCPLCAMLALAISKVKEKPVYIKETNNTGRTIITTVSVLNV
jgi:hypothetical protein